MSQSSQASSYSNTNINNESPISNTPTTPMKELSSVTYLFSLSSAVTLCL